MRTKIAQIIAEELPNFWNAVGTYQGYDSPYITIKIASSNFNINNVNGQRPNCVSLWMNENTKELSIQVFGGNGGQCIYREVGPNDPATKYLAMSRIKIPFRKPAKTEEAVLKAIRKFCIEYKKALIDNLDVLISLRYMSKEDHVQLLNI